MFTPATNENGVPAAAPPAGTRRSMGLHGATPHETSSAMRASGLVEAHHAADEPELREALEEREALLEPARPARQAEVALQQQQVVAAREARQPVVRADLVHVGRRQHKRVGPAEPAQPLGVVAPAVVVHEHLDARQPLEPRRQLPRVPPCAKALHDRADERPVAVPAFVARQGAFRRPRAASRVEQQIEQFLPRLGGRHRHGSSIFSSARQPAVTSQNGTVYTSRGLQFLRPLARLCRWALAADIPST